MRRYIQSKIFTCIFFTVLMIYGLGTKGQNDWYSYKTGDWNDPDTWTTDPGGTTLVGTFVAMDGDSYTILTGRTVTLTADVSEETLEVNIQSGAILQLGSLRFENTLNILSGQGTIKLEYNTVTPNLPTASTNSFVQANGGTIEYNNTSDFTLPITYDTYYSLKFNLSNASFVATMLHNITLNGNLTVSKGNFRINNDAATNRLVLIVYGNVSVSSGSSISVGTSSVSGGVTSPLGITGGTAPFVPYYTSYSHTVRFYGDLINNGTVRFTNQDFPVYNAFPTNGFASVFFMGDSDNTLTCNGTTDFYNLILDKGTDQTYILTVNSAAYNYFRLFGANVAGGEGGGDNPILKKALWLRNGTMKLYGKVVIPSLSEGTGAAETPAASPNADFYVPENAALMIEGPDVVVLSTADSYREVNVAYGVAAPSDVAMGINTSSGASSFSVYGTFQINNGYFSTRESGGFIYWGTSAGQIIINGGTVDAKQLRTAGSSGGLMAYRQTGGTLTLRGRLTQTVSGVTSVADLKTVPLSGTRSTGGLSATVGAFNIDRDDNIFNMTGGTIEVLDVCGNSGGNRKAFEINSLTSNISVSGGQINLKPTNATGDDMPFYVVSSAPLYNVTVDASAADAAQTIQLTGIASKTGVTERLTQPLTVLNNLTLSNNATLVANNLEVLVGGNFSMVSGNTYTPGTNRTTFNGSGAQTFTGGGTITSNFYKLKVDKSAGTITLAGTPTSYTVRDSLIISSGTIDDGGKTLYVAGHIYVGGTHTGSGKIVLNGTATQNIEANELNSNVSLGNIELFNYTNPGAQLITDITAKTLILNANTGASNYSILYIADKRLSISTSNSVVTSQGTMGFGSQKYIKSDGISSDRGLLYNISSSGAFLYPIGVSGYTPSTITISTAPTNPGTIAVVPVTGRHPSTKNAGPLEYYWKTLISGFSGAPLNTVQYSFTFTSNVPGPKGLWLRSDGWVDGNWTSSATITIPASQNIGFNSSDFTSGNPSDFNQPRILYSILSGDWDRKQTWSTVSHTGAATNQDPRTYDRLIIGGAAGTNHQITMTAALTTVAGVQIKSTTETGITGTPPTLIKPAALTTGFTVSYVSGGGRYQQFNQHLPTGDFGDFCNNETAIFEYAGGSYTIPSSSSVPGYPNLHITSSSATQTKTLPDANILVRQSLRMISTNTASNLSFNSSANQRYLTVYGDVEFTNTSQLIIPATTGVKTINIYGDINFRYNNTDNVNGIVVTSSGVTGTTHKLNFYGNTITSGNSKLTFFSAGINLMDFYLLGDENLTVTNTTGATNNFTFNKLIVSMNALENNVYFQNNFTLNASTSGSPKALQLNTGTFNIENASTNINLSSGGAAFQIPQTAALILKNGATVTVTGNGTGVFLDGKLRAESSTINMGDGTNTNTRYIEYSGSGNASLELTGTSTLTVNSQIRRSLSQTNGILDYLQSGTSAVTIFGRGVNQTRAKLEVVNTGSSFNMSGGTITIVYGGGTTYGDLYLRPASGSVTGGTINIGSTESGQTYKFDSEIVLNNLNIVSPAASNTAQIMVNPLVLNGNLNIGSNTTLNANGLDVTLKGNFTNNGTYSYGSGNTTTFNGTTQTIDGTTVTDFYNLKVNPSTSLTLIRDQLVNNNLEITTGTLIADTYDVEVKGNLTNNATHSSSTGRIILNGTSGFQGIYGNGTFGLLELDNADGARLYNNISLTKDFYLTRGILNINQYLLTLGTGTNIIGAPFSSTKMITPDGVFSNVGIRKYFDASFSDEYEFPLGVTGTPNKYTPAIVDVSSTGAGFIRVNSINDKHPATLNTNDPPNYRVLKYYWEIENSVSGFTGDIKFYYNQSDVVVDQDDEDLYVAARVIVGPADSWSKAATGPSTDNVNETTNEILFQFTGADDLGGEYTAGMDEDIPDLIPVYYSKSGARMWDVQDDWDPQAPSGGPNGFRVVVTDGSTVSTNGNRRFAYRTTINGRLEVGETYGHNLGTVSGTGTLALEDQILPAGRFDDFFNCAGGTLEYGGTKSYTMIADRIDTLNSIHFIGTGTKTLPNKDLVICDEFLINGPTVDNASNKQLTIGGTMVRSNGVFLAGSGAGATVRFKGLAAQALSGFNASTSSPLFNLEIDNPDGLTLGSQIDFDGNLKLTNGIISTTSANILYMRNDGGGKTVTPTGGSSSSYIDGPFKRHVFGGADFIFPIGNGSRYGKIGIISPSTNDWIGEYFDEPYGDLSVNTTNLSAVSGSEYWKLISPNNVDATATVQLRWDELSDINPLSVSGGINDIVVAEYDGTATQWDEKASDAPSGDDYNGTVETSANIRINNSTHPQFYTLGSKSTVTAMARFASDDDRCQGVPIPVIFSGVTSANLPFVLSYSIDFGSGYVPQTNITINTLPYSGLPTPSAGTYKLTGFTYSNPATTGMVGNDVVIVNSTPSSPTASNVPRCGPGTVTLTASGGSVGYYWYTASTGGTLLHTGASYTTVYLNATTTYYVATRNASGCESARTAVQAIINRKPEFTVTGSDTQVCDKEAFTLTVNFAYVYDLAPYTIVINNGYVNVVNTSSTEYVEYEYTNPEMEWVGPTARRDYTYTVTVTDDNGCVNDPVSPVTLYVYKIPETGPQYHIPILYGQ